MSNARTVGATALTIMRTREFQLGVEHRRAGVPPLETDSWEYERGRIWATLAPASMPLRINGRINPKALALFRAATLKAGKHPLKRKPDN